MKLAQQGWNYAEWNLVPVLFGVVACGTQTDEGRFQQT